MFPVYGVEDAPRGGLGGPCRSKFCKKLIVPEDKPRMNTNRHEDRWTSFAATTSWDKAPPGARASRPHTSWQSLGQLLYPTRPATAPGLCFDRADDVSAGRVAGRRIAGKLSGTLRECMRAGRPRSRGAPPPIILATQWGARRLAGPRPCRCGRTVPLVALCRPSCPFVNFSFPLEC